MGHRTRTRSGVMWDILSPKPADVRLEDMAWVLGHIWRFNCHTPRRYSVASHSLWIEGMLVDPSPLMRLCALLHDAHETYLSDIPSPLKNALRTLWGFDPLAPIFERTDEAIFTALGLPYPPPSMIVAQVGRLDELAGWIELMVLLHETDMSEGVNPIIFHKNSGQTWRNHVEEALATYRAENGKMELDRSKDRAA